MPILGADGKPIYSDALIQAKRELASLRRQILKVTARYDAAQTVTGNQNHWANADRLDAHSANNWKVRQDLRSRSRYEVIENNPYLKGIFLTICNDFVGSGPKLQITDPRWKKNKTRRLNVERLWNQWARCIQLRQKLWRLRMAKGVDGEGVALPFNNYRRRPGFECPIDLDFFLIECDRLASWTFQATRTFNETDGVRFDEYDVPVQYHILPYSPGTNFLGYYIVSKPFQGKWVDANRVIHWFRQDRGWQRGIPETTPCLPLCALLRRYTLAVVRAAEIAAAFSAVLETDGPPNANFWTDGNGNPIVDDPFDTLPFEMGMMTVMPYSYKLKQLESKQPIQTYDAFVGALLREISRPLLVPFNVASGSSKDSNMASAVVDTHIYRSGQTQERYHCEDNVLDVMLGMWWQELLIYDPIMAGGKGVPEHRWRWDAVGLDHTDPARVAQALQTYKEEGILTDRDIQEGRFNRDYEEWQDEITEDVTFRRKIGLSPDPELDKNRTDAGASSSSASKKKPVSNKELQALDDRIAALEEEYEGR